MFGFNLMEMVAGLPGLVMALSLHEYAHARVAVAMGDFTPKMMGRLTLNPMAHIDPIGLIMLLVARFGWAKPVMVNPNNFRDRVKGDILVALAGPAMNFLVAFLATAFLVFYADVLKMPVTPGLRSVLWLIVIYNLNFGIFNLIPIPPLDGSRVLMAVLPPEMQYKLAGLERYSFLILILFLMTPVLGYILVPLQRLLLSLYLTVLGVVFAPFL
ncbi:MAG: site-2 protease family protein [Schwartzia sp.]|nr:site-2 protease family protein [Schwartzia sp. (in: firmicutes)]